MLDVEVKTDKTLRVLWQAAGQIDRVTSKYVQADLEDIIVALKGKVQAKTPVASGVLRNKMQAEVRWQGLDLLGIINNPLIYAQPIELGRTSQKKPPPAALRAWAKRKLGDANAAYAVAWKIAERGGFVEVKPYGDRAQMFADAFDENLNWLEGKLKAIGLSVTEAVAYLFEE